MSDDDYEAADLGFVARGRGGGRQQVAVGGATISTLNGRHPDSGALSRDGEQTTVTVNPVYGKL